MLIDFDWSGVAGTAIYPTYLNPDLQRPDGVQSGKRIEPNHDKQAVDLIVQEVAEETQPADRSDPVEILAEQISDILV